MSGNKEFVKAFLRISMSLVFLYFGFQQVSDADSWTSFVPDFLTKSIFSASNIVVFNGMVELCLGIFLILGLYTRFSSLILSIHLLGIAFSIGISPLGVRDFGLALATFAVFLNGADNYTLDRRLRKKKEKE